MSAIDKSAARAAFERCVYIERPSLLRHVTALDDGQASIHTDAIAWDTWKAATGDASTELSSLRKSNAELLAALDRAANILRGGEGVQDQGEAYDLAQRVIDAAIAAAERSAS